MSLTCLDHPLVHDRLARLRAAGCSSPDFRRYLAEIAPHLLITATAKLATRPNRVQTPLEECDGREIARPLTLVPIRRAGLALLEPIHRLIPEAAVAHLGLARCEKTLQPLTYYENLPDDLAESEILVLDPMLATGGSALAALDHLISKGARHLHFLCLVASPEGLETLQKAHPDLPITTAAIDRQLNEHGYILPGLGDAGDRAFG
ncbi:MAG: uracil phosphoribosyltransferase [Verrucomicrobiales bacterium]